MISSIQIAYFTLQRMREFWKYNSNDNEILNEEVNGTNSETEQVEYLIDLNENIYIYWLRDTKSNCSFKLERVQKINYGGTIKKKNLKQ